MLLPSPFPDELFVSVLARMGRLNGIGDYRDLLGEAEAGKPCASFINAQLDLPAYCKGISFAYGTPEFLLNELTSLGIRRRLGELGEREWGAIVHGGQRISLTTLAVPSSIVLCFCRSCIRNDIKDFGEAYWHRTHHLPAIRVCIQHRECLQRVQVKRAHLHQHYPLPGEFLNLSQVSEEIGMDEGAAYGIGCFVERLLLTKDIKVCAELIFGLLMEALRERRLASKSGSICETELSQYLTQELFSRSADYGSTKVQSFIRQVLRSIQNPVSGLVTGRAILLYCLFGNFSLFQQHLAWKDVIESGAGVASLDDSERFHAPDVQAIHRAHCLKFMKANQGCSRLDFTRAEYRSFRWLLHNDKAWLDRQLPIPHRGGKQLALF